MESAYPVLERPCPFGRWIPEDRFQGEEQALSRVEKGRAGRDMGPSTRAPVPPNPPPCPWVKRLGPRRACGCGG